MKKNKHKFNRLLISLTAAHLVATTYAHAGQTTRISSAVAQGNSYSWLPSISADGRYVAFNSNANNLVAGDTNGYNDVYVRDRVTGKTSRISVSSAGVQANQGSDIGSISADGRYVAFTSYADNLVADDTNATDDVFVRDRVTGKTTRVSVSSEGIQGNNLFGSSNAVISADGRYVAFMSDADNLVAGDTNGYDDVFVRDRLTGMTTRISVNSAGAQGNDLSGLGAISADGRYIAFWSYADNLVAGDKNGQSDVFVRDRLTGKTSRVSVSSTGAEGNNLGSFEAVISADGRYVAFRSFSDNLVSGDTNGEADIFVRDRVSGTTSRVNVSSAGVQGNNSSDIGSISADGRYVAFSSLASNLVSWDTNGWHDSFVRDRLTGTTTLVSVSSAGVQGNGFGSSEPTINADGRYVAFSSDSDNLVAGDTNNTYDVFVRDRLLNNSVSDLQATVTTKPASVKQGQTASYKFTVKNNGPDSATNVALTDIVSNGTVLSITPSQGTCNKAAISVCSLGTLVVGANATIAVNIKADANPLTQQLSVSASSKDNVPVNNAVNISTTVTP